MKAYAKAYEDEGRAYYRAFADFSKADFHHATHQELALAVEEIHRALTQFAEWQFTAFFPIDGLGKEIEARLSAYPFGRELLMAMATPNKETEIAYARATLLEIASRKKRTKALNDFARKYAWLPVYEFIDAPWTEKDFSAQIADITDPRKELRHYRRGRREGLATYRRLLKKVADKKLKRKIEVMHAFSYLKEMRDDCRRHAYYLMRPFWEEVAKRLTLSVPETNYCLAEELSALLRGVKSVSRDEIKKRMQCYALIIERGRVKIVSGTAARAYALSASPQAWSTISGTPAYGGVIRGRARIIYHQGEFSNFKHGEILVTTMTHPEFVVIMKKAKAIITDEGGITCHAAITAREMKKPCIIGTKNATKVLKDGDTIEVNADTGVVSRL
ncbi:hypothetical protein HY627_00570 [Candidatus Uhrbacteria bacterium]|nr:hypothetical protein [Candidatus Uhrbacteria bacterium]